MFRIGNEQWYLLIDHHSSCIPVHVQFLKDRLRGTIIDENGAVAPGVKVGLTNPSQGFRGSCTTNSKGIFVLPLRSSIWPKNVELYEITTTKVLTVSLKVKTHVKRQIDFHRINFHQIKKHTSNSTFLHQTVVRLVSHLSLLFVILVSHLILLFLILAFEWSTGQIHLLFSH
ncbi:MAG: carboxypeptidase-like regulatory domain-containing protein [Pyrinomonadaceae bacterium]